METMISEGNWFNSNEPCLSFNLITAYDILPVYLNSKAIESSLDFIWLQLPLFLTWVNVNPTMEK